MRLQLLHNLFRIHSIDAQNLEPEILAMCNSQPVFRDAKYLTHKSNYLFITVFKILIVGFHRDSKAQ